MKYHASIQIFVSRPDICGNTYGAFAYTDHVTGKVVKGLVGSHGNLACTYRHSDGYLVHETQMPIRQWNRLVKGWDYAGDGCDDTKRWVAEGLK